MSFGSRWLTCFMLVTLAAGDCLADTFTIGFFEGGVYPAHSEFRECFRNQLQVMTPPGIDLIYSPDGFKSAEWDREKSRTMARELKQNKAIDLVVALGPWTVEDLLAVDFNRPIVAALRYDPAIEGLLDDRGRPIADNLTVRLRPNKLVSDITYLTSLTPVKKLGLLSFPSDNKTDQLLAAVRNLGSRLGFEVVTAEGYDRNDTYAFFNAYNQLSGKVDALYLPPLWGFNSDKIRQFYAMVGRDKILSFSSEGQYHALRGALASGSLESSLAKAHYHAWKVVRIMDGATPGDLPTVFADDPGLTINESTARQLGMDIRSERRYDIAVLNAPPPDDVERLTVIDAVNIALAQSPDYQSRYAALTAAEHAVAEARSGYLPEVSLGMRADHFDPNAVHNDDQYRADRFRADLRLDQPLFAPGVGRDVDQASLSEEVAASDLRQSGLDLERGVTLAFLKTVQVEQVKSVLQIHKRQVRECFYLAQLRLKLGEAGAEQVWRWESEWLDALQALRAVESELNIARIRLNTMLGRPGDYPFVTDWQHFTDAQFFREEAVLNRVIGLPDGREQLVSALIDLAMVNNPRLARSDLGLDLGRSSLTRNRADFLPRIGFSARLGMSRERAEVIGFEEQNPSWSVGIGLELPLFKGGHRFKERNRLQAELDRLEYRRDQTTLEVIARLRVDVELMLSRAEEFPITARAAELANQYFPEVQTRFGAGAVTIVELLEAVNLDRDASVKAINTQIGYFSQLVELCHTVGIPVHESGRSINEEVLFHISTLVVGGRN
ncbi:MAG: TolC family protein [candidate division Zixibacteria bacterium]|nr:TolC family protein [candidate division Zixibacteria bacterium]